MKVLLNLCVLVILLVLSGFHEDVIQAAPILPAETALDMMAHIPQWHCMRYRKFELVRRCRHFKNILRKT